MPYGYPQAPFYGYPAPPGLLPLNQPLQAPAPPPPFVPAPANRRGIGRGRGALRGLGRAAANRAAIIHGAPRDNFVAAPALVPGDPLELRRHMAARVAPPPPIVLPQNQPQLALNPIAANLLDAAPIAGNGLPAAPAADQVAQVAQDPMVIDLAVEPENPVAAKGKGGAPKKGLDFYVDEDAFIVKDSKIQKGPDGKPIEALVCAICPRGFKSEEDCAQLARHGGRSG